MKTGRATPTDGSAESTVFADVERMELNGASLRVYDCAGQVFHGYGTKWFGFCVVVVLGVACRLGLRCLPDHCRMSKILPGRYFSLEQCVIRLVCRQYFLPVDISLRSIVILNR